MAAWPLPSCARLARRYAAYHSRPAPAAVAASSTGWRLANLVAALAPTLSAPILAPASSHVPAFLTLLPTIVARPRAPSYRESIRFMVVVLRAGEAVSDAIC